MMIKFQVSRRNIDAKGFIFKTIGPPTSKSDAKGVPWASKSYGKMVLTKFQNVTSWDETVFLRKLPVYKM